MQTQGKGVSGGETPLLRGPAIFERAGLFACELTDWISFDWFIERELFPTGRLRGGTREGAG